VFPCFEFFSKDQKYILSRHIFVNDIAALAKQIREIEFIIVQLLDLQYLFGWSGQELQGYRPFFQPYRYPLPLLGFPPPVGCEFCFQEQPGHPEKHRTLNAHGKPRRLKSSE